MPVIDQDLVAALADARAMLLQAGQHGRVAVIHDRTAVTRHVAGTGVVLALLTCAEATEAKTTEEKTTKETSGANKTDLTITLVLKARPQTGAKFQHCNAVNAFYRRPRSAATKIHRTEPTALGRR